MAQLKIITYPNPLLEKKAQIVKNPQAPEIKRLILDMLETMEKNNGVGLAANQVGQPENICVVKVEGKTHIFVNPYLKSKSWSKIICEEGCLSFPGKFIPVKRSKNIKIEALDRNGKKIVLKAEGFLSRVIQHEIDHLSGILFIEKEVKKRKK